GVAALAAPGIPYRPGLGASPARAPVRFRVDRGGLRVGGRVHRHELAALPLDQVEAAAGRAGGVPAQGAQDRRPRATGEGWVDRVVVDLPGRLGDRLDELAGGVRLGGAVVDRVRGAAVGRQVRAGEVGAAERGRAGEPVAGGHDALHVVRADLVGELGRRV